jgi:hypothetical protein
MKKTTLQHNDIDAGPSIREAGVGIAQAGDAFRRDVENLRDALNLAFRPAGPTLIESRTEPPVPDRPHMVLSLKDADELDDQQHTIAVRISLLKHVLSSLDPEQCYDHALFQGLQTLAHEIEEASDKIKELLERVQSKEGE